mmetsp:Transcript_1513/g.3225  ORF Transcript_1513/g.3225 Transcript_1513/m.3225 type:complete len:218 (+) Transcript_1513:41-694(+)
MHVLRRDHKTIRLRPGQGTQIEISQDPSRLSRSDHLQAHGMHRLTSLHGAGGLLLRPLQRQGRRVLLRHAAIPGGLVGHALRRVQFGQTRAGGTATGSEAGREDTQREHRVHAQGEEADVRNAAVVARVERRRVRAHRERNEKSITGVQNETILAQGPAVDHEGMLGLRYEIPSRDDRGASSIGTLHRRFGVVVSESPSPQWHAGRMVEVGREFQGR